MGGHTGKMLQLCEHQRAEVDPAVLPTGTYTYMSSAALHKLRCLQWHGCGNDDDVVVDDGHMLVMVLLMLKPFQATPTTLWWL